VRLINSTVRRVVAVILRILLSLGFFAAGITKFLPASNWHARFAGWGYAPWFVPVIGILELLGVLGLWVPGLARPAAGLLAVILMGALYTNVTHPPLVEAIRPAVFLVLLGAMYIAAGERGTLPDESTYVQHDRSRR
jgi:uncharacterized membrane protein